MPKIIIWAPGKAATALCCFFALILGLLPLANTARAQITQTARVELNDAIPQIYIGAHIYLTPDPEKKLTYQVITSRHQNNLRGKRQGKNLINLGTVAPPTWMVFSVTNNSSQEEWMLHFGQIFDGRSALAHKLMVRNYTTGETFARALREDNNENAFGEDLHGPALPIRITKGQTELIAMYIEAEGGLPNTITPKLIRKDAYINVLRFGDLYASIAAVFFIGIAGFFMAIAYIKQKKEYLFILGYYLINFCLFYSINALFFASMALSGEFLFMLYAASALAGLMMTKSFLGITIEDHAQNTAIFASGAIVIFSTLFNTVLFSEETILDDLLIFLPATLALAVMVAVSFLQGQAGKYSAYFFSSGWTVALIGNTVTALSAASFISTNTFTINAYWLAFIPQAFFFVIACNKKLLMTEQAERHLQSRENRAAQSLARLQQSKESADQARLLRVIERERELMAELREREMQRTEEMRTAKDMADEANRSKSAFLAVVSHEIRTPMTGILGMVRLLGDTKLSKEQTDYAQAIQNSGDTMMALLNDILDFEKIESGNMDLEEIDFDIMKLVQGVVTLMSGHAEEKGISLKSDISDNFPRHLIGDPTRLRQIFLNLINNAIKFTDDGSVIIQLRATKLSNKSEDLKGDYEIYFAVVDTGIGIPEYVQKNLFSPFQQAEKSTARKYGGTGLGLAICKRLTEAMGSSLRVESVEGEGSTFFFSALMETGRAEASEENVTAKATAQFDTPPMQVLVIEDNEMNRKVLQGFLKKDGHSVTLAESGEKALEIIENSSFEVILTDITLSGMSGVETTKTIRTLPDRNKASTPVIAVTGNIAASDIEEYYDAGINGFIAKPIDPEELSLTLENVHKGDLEHPVKLSDTYNEPPIENAEKDLSQEIDGSTENSDEEKTELQVRMEELHTEAVSPVQQYLQANEDESKEKGSEKGDVEGGGETDHYDYDSFDLDDYDSFEEATALFENEENNDGSAVFDQSMLQTLIETLGKEQFDDLIKGFIDTANDIIGALVELKETKNEAEIQDRAHELKGMAANFGFTELSKISREIEQAMHRNDFDSALLEIERLPDANQRAVDSIVEWYNEEG